MLGDLAASLAEELASKARNLSASDVVLRLYDDGPKRLHDMLRAALRRSQAVGSYVKERKGAVPRRMIYVAHCGSGYVTRAIEEVLAEEGCLADLGGNTGR